MADWTEFFNEEDKLAVLDAMADIVENDEEEAYVFGSGQYYAHVQNYATKVKIRVLDSEAWQAVPPPVASLEVSTKTPGG
jgi:hypothetical protein